MECAKCEEREAIPERGLCSECYVEWRDKCQRRGPNALIKAVLEGGSPAHVEDALLEQLCVLVRKHPYSPRAFFVTLEDLGIMGKNKVPLKMFVATQASVLLRARAQSVGTERGFWLWEHAVCCMVADYWNIPADLRVGHCYYSDWGAPPKNWADDVNEYRVAILARAISRGRFARGQIGA